MFISGGFVVCVHFLQSFGITAWPRDPAATVSSRMAPDVSRLSRGTSYSDEVADVAESRDVTRDRRYLRASLGQRTGWPGADVVIICVATSAAGVCHPIGPNKRDWHCRCCRGKNDDLLSEVIAGDCDDRKGDLWTLFVVRQRIHHCFSLAF